MWFKSKAPVLGDFEQLVLLGVLRLEARNTSYGAAIRQEIHGRSGRDVSINAIYTTLERLENKRFLRSWVGEPDAGARRAAPQVLRPPARGDRRASTGVPRLHLDGRRPREPAGAEMSHAVRPPPLAIWLLSQRLSDEWREFVVGDLEEEFATRAARSPFAARAWFWGQTFARW